MSRHVLQLRSLVIVFLVTTLTACLSDRRSLTIRAENDDLPLGDSQDRHYTQGVRIDCALPAEDAPALARRAAHALDHASLRALDARAPSADDARELGFFVGQHMYTPEDIEDPNPIPDDRPYTGWLYVGFRSSEYVEGSPERDDDSQTSTEFSIGVTGPPSFAETIQKGWHRLIGAPRPKGWDHQLDAEPTLQLAAQHHRRVHFAGDADGLAWDAAWKAGYNLGNFFTSGALAGTLRFGFNLPRGFTQPFIDPALKLAGPLAVAAAPEVRGCALFGHVTFEERCVLRNLALDGNTFESSPHVDRETLVTDLTVGVAVRIECFEIGYALNIRSAEFEEQEDSHRFGSIYLRFGRTW